MQERRYEVDWLRIIAMLAVFLYHCTRFFDPEGWHLKNTEQSELLFVLMRGLIWTWVMELFFLLSGIGSWYALSSSRAGAYIWGRIKRLLIPLYTVGLFVLLPLQFYFELFTNRGYSDNFWQIIPGYFAAFKPPSITQSPFSLLPFPFLGHLWFLQYLFLISLISLPLLLYFKSRQGQRWVAKLAGWCDSRGGIFLFVIPLSLALIGLQGFFETQYSWANLFWYAIFFIIGSMMAADKRFTDSIRRHGWICLVLWIVGFALVGLLVSVLDYDPYPGKEPFSFVFVLFQIAWTITSWSAVVFVLNIGARYLNTNQKFLAYCNEAVLPFYLFHQTIILCVGWYIIRWDMGILIKILIIAAVSFLMIMSLYEIFVRRFNIVRFFFGMRPKKKPSATPVPRPEGISKPKDKK